jgi:anti-sigma B factor antagonist
VTVLDGREPVVVALDGQIDLHNAAELREAIIAGLASDAPGIVLDLTGVDFLDSAGLGILVGAERRARSLGKTFRLTGVAGRVQRVLDLSGLPSAG